MVKWTVAVAFSFFLLMLLSGLVSSGLIDNLFGAPRALECATLSPQVTMAQWISLSFIALVLGTMIVAAGWVLSGAFASQQYSEFLRVKLWEIIETAALLSILSLSVAGLNQWAVSNIDTSRTYATVIKNTVTFDFGLMMGASMVTGFLVNINPQFKIPGQAFLSVGFQVAPMFKPIMDMMGMTMQLVTTAVGLWNAQLMLLCFIKTSMLTILIPAAFFLRALGIKGGGNTLLAIAIALYFGYPYLMVMMGQIVTDHVASDLTTSGVKHVWGTCTDQPICCVVPGTAVPSDFDKPFIPNAKTDSDLWKTNLAYRIDQKTVLESSFFMTFDGSLPNGVGNSCMYNSVLGRAYKTIMGDIIAKLDFWTAIGGGLAAFGTVLLLKFLNMSWIVVFAMIPVSFFAIHAILEMVYFVFIVTIMLPLFMVFITLTLGREIAKALGTEIDLSALEKLI